MKILIATDGSDFSKAAVEECCRIAINRESEVLIVSSYEDAYPMAAEPFAVSTEYYAKLDADLRELAGTFVNQARKMIETRFPGLVISTEVLPGSAVQQIIGRAEEWNADLIVLGSHGRGFWGRLLGSVSNGVIHHAPCSVLVVRKPAKKGEKT